MIVGGIDAAEAMNIKDVLAKEHGPDSKKRGGGSHDDHDGSMIL